MQKNPIGWIELPALDLDRAEAFYKNFFGFDFDRQEEVHGETMSWFLPMDQEGYGSGLTFVMGPKYVPAGTKGPLLYFTAPEGSVEKALRKAADMQINIITEIRDIGEHGFYAIIEDSEGNHIAIHSMER